MFVYVWLIQRAGPVFVSFTTYMSPLWATGLGVLFLGEPLHWSMVGALALILYCARLVDDEKTGESELIREEARALLDLLTPIAKSWPSEYCLEANKLAIHTLAVIPNTPQHPPHHRLQIHR